MIAGASYDKIDDQGLHITVNDQPTVLEVDHVIICAGQESLYCNVRPTKSRW